MMHKHHECHTRQFEGCSNYLRSRARTRSPFPFTFEFLRGIFIFQRGVSRRKRPLPPADPTPVSMVGKNRSAPTKVNGQRSYQAHPPNVRTVR